MNGLVSRVIKSGLLAGIAFSALTGCGGGGSNNDQGVAFTLNGFFQSGSGGGEDDDSAGLVGTTLTFGSTFNAAADVQNNLVGQGIRVRRIFLSYNIPGAAVSLPSTSVGVTTVLGPTECADPLNLECVDTTLPSAFRTENQSRISFPMIPASVNEYLVLNRGSLPALPFQLEVTVSIDGVTTSGDTLRTNDGVFTIEYLSDSGVDEEDPAADPEVAAAEF